MVSTAETSHNQNDNDTLMDMVVPKPEPAQDGHGSMSSSGSTPEAEAEALTQDVAQTQKRKGGRKPIYATSEERKQRNRQAQAAFRERRTEYIKQLETTIKRNEESLQSLQQSHRSAADECLMLRYKNSLLERILLEKGVDVQAELRLKTGNATGVGPTKPSAIAPKRSSPLQRAALRANPGPRHAAGIAPKADPPVLTQQHRDGAYHIRSPQLQPTPPSHVSSPSTGRSPGFGLQGAISPKGTEFSAQQQQPLGRASMLAQPRGFAPGTSVGLNHGENIDTTHPPQTMIPASSMASRMPSAFYPSPFHKHYDQLEQEYDAQADMLDDGDPQGDTLDPTTYATDFNRPPVPTRAGVPGHASLNTHGREVDNGLYNDNNTLFSPFEPMLDTDAFGLSASMHFQTPFSYEQSNLRQ